MSVLAAEKDLPGFVKNDEELNTGLPGRPGFGGRPSFTGYVCGHFRGLLNRVALTPANRKDEDRHAAKLNYPHGELPYVPLVGRVVRTQKTALLEFYEGAYQFRSPAEARQFAAGSIGSNRLDDALKEFPYRVPGTEAVAFSGAMDAEARDAEHLYRIVARIGRSVLTISAQGGQELSWSTVRPMAGTLVARLQQSPP
ncbi:hypothetical protein [Actinomadura macrotermitis]|uniref:hypothetical protein n=1 Tax=Actinomadura macrotermitis TaxID=2585200 RepID=UPI0012955E5C|nr:hypothetical protein [Actinomadura macrotermitis]